MLRRKKAKATGRRKRETTDEETEKGKDLKQGYQVYHTSIWTTQMRMQHAEGIGIGSDILLRVVYTSTAEYFILIHTKIKLSCRLILLYV